MQHSNSTSLGTRLQWVIRAAVILSLGLVAFGIWGFLTTHERANEKMVRCLRAQELMGDILQLDELLTMSARMGAATGNLTWEKRYQQNVATLDNAIKEATALIPEAIAQQFTAQTDNANAQLVGMELRSFELVRQQRNKEALALLLSEQYTEQKSVYAAGVAVLHGAVKQQVAAAEYEEERANRLTIVVSVVIGGVLLLVWISIETMARRHLAQRLQAESILQTSRAQLQAIMDNTPAVVFVKDREGRYQFINPRYEQLFHVRREEILGKTDYDLFPHDVADVLRANDSGVLAAGTARESEEVVPQDDGPHSYMSLKFPLRDGAGKAYAICGIATDITDRKLAEEERQKLVSLVENSGDFIGLAGLDHRATFVNAAGCKLVGMDDSGEVRSWNIWDFLHPSVHEDHRQVILPLVQSAGTWCGETLFRHSKTGAAIPVEMSAFVVQHPQTHQPLCLATVAHDISERRRIEAVNKQLAERNSALVEALGEVVYDRHPPTDRVEWGGDFTRVLGYSVEEMGQDTASWISRVHPEELANVLAEVEDAQHKSRLYDLEYRFCRDDGTYAWVHDRGVLHLNASGHLERIVGVMRDITGRRNAEEELRQLNAQLENRVRQRTLELEQMNASLRGSEEQVRLLLECSAEGIYGADMQGLCIFCNPACACLLGYKDAHELLGKNMHALMHHTRPDGTDYPVEECRIYQAFRKGVETHIDDEVFWRVDGTCFPVEYRSHPLRRDGQVIGAVVNFSDITERQRTQQELCRAKETAEAGSRAKSEFLANMSHEIRTPMNGILGMTALALDTNLTSEQRQFLEAVRDSGESLLRLLNDILDFSKIEAGKLDFDEADFSLDAAFGGAVKTLAQRAHEKGLELTYHVAPDVPDGLVGDAGRLRQIIVNLIGNAVKFTQRGEVEVRVRADDLSNDNVLLHVTVRDTGIGIAPEQQRLIFEPFRQADSSTTRRFGGTGLGLTISVQLVERMMGKIWLESEPGQGSTFHFTARLGRSRVLPAQDFPAPPIKLRGMPALVVDDNPTNQRILEELLRRWRMRPTVVDGSSAALAALEKAHSDGEPISLVLVDCMMPGKDGFSLAEHIKLRPGLNNVTMIMLTSSPRTGDAARCRELGIATYLIKPVRPMELLDAIVNSLRISWQDRKTPPAAAQVSMAPNRRRLRVLLAEDNLINQRVATHMLEDSGHVAVLASDGREVLQLLARETFDLILMDVQMPEMDGFAATARIRAQEQETGQHLPIIALTAHAMKGDRERCLAAGMDGYLTKPIRPDELNQAISDVAQDETNLAPVHRKNGTPSAPPALDRAALLARVGHQRQRLGRLVEIFHNSCPGMLQAIRDALSRADGVGLSRAAHTLKGSVGSLGGTVVFQQATQFEGLGLSGDLTQAAQSLRALEQEVDRFQKELVHLIQEEQE